MSGQLRTPGSHGECLRGIKKLERGEKKVDEWRDLGWREVGAEEEERMRIWRAGPGVQAYYMTQYVVSEITFHIQRTPRKPTEAFFMARESL